MFVAAQCVQLTDCLACCPPPASLASLLDLSSTCSLTLALHRTLHPEKWKSSLVATKKSFIHFMLTSSLRRCAATFTKQQTFISFQYKNKNIGNKSIKIPIRRSIKEDFCKTLICRKSPNLNLVFNPSTSYSSTSEV